MKKLYEKNELTFAIVWIVIYCFLQSLANSLNEEIGIEFSASAILCIIQTVVLFVFIQKNGLMKRYGLCKPDVSASRFLYYIPLIILATAGFWNGAAVNYPLMGSVCRVVGMLCVGFLEEIIFRGFLFKAMEKNNVKAAVIVSSVTFGIGHLVNLFNGSGMALVDNLCQIIFAVAVGFLLVTIFYRGGSLIPCILTHSAINSLNTFANEAGVTQGKQIICSLIMIVITVAYTLILMKTLPQKKELRSDSE
ncbi:MAG: CPBP family intramembrane metalloprotease [Roseburia sp.]|nr:CPBP family intramembrane metalloprotease [Roseburia sp.]